MGTHILAIDQGTTSSRAIIFDANMCAVSTGQQEFTQHYPHSGWVEHDPEEIWQTVLATCREAIQNAKLSAKDIAAIGITNQRETTIVWDRKTGAPLHNAIVWQDRRTASMCADLKQDGHEAQFTKATGLLLDPYFSGTKLAWILDHVEGARARAERGELAFGTIDAFLIWRLTEGAVHATDATNASRTLMFNIETQKWDDALLNILNVPKSILPDVKDCAADFGMTHASLFGEAIPIRGVAGDQHAAMLGQACFAPGMVKSTYGTGCFAVLNTGEDLVRSQNRLLSTVAYRIGGQVTYALEGSIFVAGAAVQWLRDGLGIIDAATETDALAAAADPTQNVYLVPGFVGLGAPHWDADARGAIFGLTRNSGPREFSRAALESVCYQTNDLLEAMRRDWGGNEAEMVLRVDGGMSASDWTMQRLADILDAPVDRPHIIETTALGAAWLAGMYQGVWPDAETFAKSWSVEKRFAPEMDSPTRIDKIAGWQDAVRRTLSTF